MKTILQLTQEYSKNYSNNMARVLNICKIKRCAQHIISDFREHLRNQSLDYL